MKPRRSRHTNQGLTLIEVVVIVLVIASFVMVLVPMLARPHRTRCLVSCANNLKQVGLAFKVWAGDNNDKYPMAVSVTNGGAMGLTETTDGLKVFQVTSNELSTPNILLCPEDALRHSAATNFTDDLTNKVSYFAGADATEANPQLFLSGDDNFLQDQSPVPPGLVNVASTARLEWDNRRHGNVTKQGWFNADKKTVYGNIGLTDGSVQEVTSSGLTNLLYQTGLATNRLVIP